MCPNLTKDVQSNNYMELFLFPVFIFWFLLEGRGISLYYILM